VRIWQPRGVKCPKALRWQEYTQLYPTTAITGDTNEMKALGLEKWGMPAFFYEKTKWVQDEAAFSVFQTFFIIVVLAGGAAMFAKGTYLLFDISVKSGAAEYLITQRTSSNKEIDSAKTRVVACCMCRSDVFIHCFPRS